jgi:hypothetical protein
MSTVIIIDDYMILKAKMNLKITFDFNFCLQNEKKWMSELSEKRKKLSKSNLLEIFFLANSIIFFNISFVSKYLKSQNLYFKLQN